MLLYNYTHFLRNIFDRPFECPIINKGGDSEAPKMIFEPECAKKLQMIRKANNDNWVGLNPCKYGFFLLCILFSEQVQHICNNIT